MAIGLGIHSRKDYAHLLRQLLPFGPAWDKEEIDQVCNGLAAEFERLDRRISALYSEMDPATVSELVPDWERVMGLPDPCIGPNQSFSERRAEVRERLTTVGEQTADYFLRIAAKRGYKNAKILEAHAPRCGRSRCGRDHMGTWQQQYFWQLLTGERKAIGSRCGVSYMGSARIAAVEGDALRCIIRRYAPAHTVFTLKFPQQ